MSTISLKLKDHLKIKLIFQISHEEFFFNSKENSAMFWSMPKSHMCTKFIRVTHTQQRVQDLTELIWSCVI